MSGDGFQGRLAVKQHLLRRRQIKFSGDIVLDVFEICHSVTFKNGKTMLEILLSRHHRKRLRKFLPLKSPVVLVNRVATIMSIEHIWGLVSNTQPKELACRPRFGE